MPTYDYQCTECGDFDALRPIVRRDEPAECPACGVLARRVFAAGPRLALLDASTRTAMDTNERARHEPKRLSDVIRGRHPSGCGCCSSSGMRRGATVTGANGNKAFAGRRPWMISH